MALSASSNEAFLASADSMATLCGLLHFSYEKRLSSPISFQFSEPANPSLAALRWSKSLMMRRCTAKASPCHFLLTRLPPLCRLCLGNVNHVRDPFLAEKPQSAPRSLKLGSHLLHHVAFLVEERFHLDFMPGKLCADFRFSGFCNTIVKKQGFSRFLGFWAVPGLTTSLSNHMPWMSLGLEELASLISLNVNVCDGFCAPRCSSNLHHPPRCLFHSQVFRVHYPTALLLMLVKEILEKSCLVVRHRRGWRICYMISMTFVTAFEYFTNQSIRCNVLSRSCSP